MVKLALNLHLKSKETKVLVPTFPNVKYHIDTATCTTEPKNHM